ncbi:L-seryl-tRNA(Sec) kinase-like [Hypanus sabinus]|uniref:L-seryl-tRNA(Sec) kinase-like n=1 Tax=Hypanus sabinus TaxID=79690 RepID=UPI0028C4CBC4|nr:L-seryl-tRNA(Sec) kinase-like [Hypanus sabinus]
MRAGCVCLLAGLPAAGKTTLARLLPKLLQPRSESIVLCYDDVIPGEAFLATTEAGSDSSTGTSSFWKLYRHKLLVYIECLIQAINGNGHLCLSGNEHDLMWECFIQSLKQQQIISGETQHGVQQYTICIKHSKPLVIILDDNFYYQSMRYEVYQMVRRNSIGFLQLFLDCPVELCLKRNHERGSLVNDETIVLMSAKIQLPDPEKNSWEKNSIILKNSKNIMEDEMQKLFELLDSSLENPEKPLEENIEQKERDRAICAANVLHQVDQAFRRLVSQTMKTAKAKNLTKCNLKLLSEELNKLKTVLLEDLRHLISKGNPIKPCDVDGIVQVSAHEFDQRKEEILRNFLKSLS